MNQVRDGAVSSAGAGGFALSKWITKLAVVGSSGYWTCPVPTAQIFHFMCRACRLAETVSALQLLKWSLGVHRTVFGWARRRTLNTDGKRNPPFLS